MARERRARVSLAGRGIHEYMEHRYGDWKYPKGILEKRHFPWRARSVRFCTYESRYVHPDLHARRDADRTPAEDTGLRPVTDGCVHEARLMLKAAREDRTRRSTSSCTSTTARPLQAILDRRRRARRDRVTGQRSRRLVGAMDRPDGAPDDTREPGARPSRALVDFPSERTMPFVYGP